MEKKGKDPASRSRGGHESPPLSDPAALAPELRRLLLRAYDEGRRNLPWRSESDPYRIWVSEVMLQQTRVESVIPYYKEWVRRFPDLEALATAEEEEVLRAWQGLGYYSRARRLHGAAKVIRERFGGTIPNRAEELKALPGIGEYTAGAVASIAFGEVVPAVDGNVRRVLSRLLDLGNPSASELRKIADDLVDPLRPGDFNQALMELGALVCGPRSPACTRCPLQALCLARGRGTVEERPARTRRGAVREVEVAVLVAVSGPPRAWRFFLRKRLEKGLLEGMWEFPGADVPAGGGARQRAVELMDELGFEETRSRTPLAGAGAEAGEDVSLLPMDPVIHLFSHLKARYFPFLARVRRKENPAGAGRWLSLRETGTVPLPVAQGRILASALEALQSLIGS